MQRYSPGPQIQSRSQNRILKVRLHREIFARELSEDRTGNGNRTTISRSIEKPEILRGISKGILRKER